MTVYNITTLNNRYIRHAADEARKKQYITANAAEAIYTQHPVDLYSPNLFVKTGLGFLTIFIALCSAALLALFLDLNHLFGSFLIIVGCACYGLLELMTGQKKHYNSGVDNVLMFATVLFIVSCLGIGYSISSPQVLSLVVFVLTAWFAIRFADRLAAIVASVSILQSVFTTYVEIGEFTISSFPYVLMAVSGSIYFSANRVIKTAGNIYRSVWQSVSLTALLSFYFAGNMYVIQDLSESSYLLQINSPLSFPWFFWAWTMLFPVVCLARGIRKKDVVLMRVGALLIAVSVLTFRYYYSIVPPETAMVVAGALLLVISYLLMRYLQSNKHGFVFDNKSDKESETQNLEGLVIGQTVGQHHQPEQQNQLGGGSFGGAGAGSEY